MIHPKLDRITFLFVSLLVLSTAAIILVASDGFDKILSKADQSENVSSFSIINFSNSYRRDIQRIFNYYLLERSKLDFSKDSENRQWIDLLSKTREELLLLKTTSEWQNKHLLLILDIDKMREDLTAGNWEKAQADEAGLIARFNKI
ncbi:MAG TPA: hypothetical protein DEB73_02290 [Candidatus Magasanikbacteria bacterium]|uniref:Uncharacterized protein n=2 Tax=Candidatus Magasanikiibacteriota TaxID=1752731 RepID=A0A0G0YSG9_9BACT|nr:MAG: hypothetical protein UU49_C0021G0006 [Candidatus Magasanikbacteria bacterium GW2011_GWC2_41_17]KKS12611.1 MAG: hypothetical protein UU69_C0029G0003 [Candidatus Magasanikbacteria bacterium GW2011_GWA2_41_55]HBV58067.1 hypothetical protein [Candidatus Magasanikbacteria bacterium]HBX16402.1 hypothetical protein [Candidatus Magasanikbacteria bacterium]